MNKRRNDYCCPSKGWSGSNNQDSNRKNTKEIIRISKNSTENLSEKISLPISKGFAGKRYYKVLDGLFSIIKDKGYKINFDDDYLIDDIMRILGVDQDLKNHYPISDRDRLVSEKKRFIVQYGKLIANIISNTNREIDPHLIGSKTGFHVDTIKQVISYLHDKYNLSIEIKNRTSEDVNKEIVFYVKKNFYDNKIFWTQKQIDEGYVKKWTIKQFNTIYNEIASKQFYLKPETEWHQDTKRIVSSIIKSIPLILDDSQGYPSLTDIVNNTSLDYNTITRISKLVRKDHHLHFNINGDRNICRKQEVKQKLSETYTQKRNLRKEITLYIKNNFYNNYKFWTQDQLKRGYIGEWSRNQLQKILDEVKRNFSIQGVRLVKSLSTPIDNATAILRIAKLVSMVMDNVKFYPSLMEICRQTNLDKTLVESLAFILRSEDYNVRYPVGGKIMVEIRKTGYPPEFYDKELRERVRLFQTVIIEGDKLRQDPNGVFRDLWTGEPITRGSSYVFHHINYVKLETYLENLGCILATTHGRIWGKMNSPNAQEYLTQVMLLLQKNKDDIKNGKVPQSWRKFLSSNVSSQQNMDHWFKKKIF